jgi:hypothetical protein
MSDSTSDFLTALLAAPEDRRAEALRVLRGVADQDVPADRGPEPYLTLRGVGRRLGVSPCSLWRWQVPGHELGGRRRFRLSEVAEYLESAEFKRRADDLKEVRRDGAGSAKRGARDAKVMKGRCDMDG